MKKKWLSLRYVPELRKLLRKMKITLFFLFAIILGSFASESYSQATKLTLNVENSSVKEILSEIERQSEFRFFYSGSVDIDRIVSVNKRNSKIFEILDEIFTGTEIEYEVIGRQIALVSKGEHYTLPTNIQDQQRSVSGKVVDSEGLPLPGVTVVVKGTSNGTVTNADGNYSVTNITEDATLVFSFVGMLTQEVEVGMQTTVNVTMKADAIGVDEVVVIGYGTQKKSNMTAAVETVNTEVLQNRPVKTVSEMLQGVVPNLNISMKSGAPDAEASINIRGFTGINSLGSPLILVDGVEQDINLVNANDIENISVLKDAAASAIYGSRAPNGVILITTKTGKRGQKMSINYSGDIQINQPINLPHSATSVDFANYLNMAHFDNQVAQFYPEATIQRMQDYIDGKITDNNIILANGRWGEHTDANANTDYFAYAFKDYSVSDSHNLSVSGGTDKTSYYVGLGYLSKEGIYNSDIDNYDRYSTIVKVNTDVTDWLSFNINTRYSRELTERPNYRDASSSSASDANFFSNLAYFPNIPIFNPDGSYHRLSAMPTLTGIAGKINTTLDDFWITTGAEFKPFKGITLKGNYSWNSSSNLYNRTTLQFYVDEPNGEVLRSARSANLDKIYELMGKETYSTVDFTATYQKQIKKHDFLVMAGYNQEVKNYHRLIGSNSDFYTQTLPTLSGAYGTNAVADDQIGHWATQGYFFRGSYNYDGKYLFDFNGRYDAASKYPKDSRWAFFPSFSFGYNIAKEKFWTVDQISSLKLTGSWGKLGDLAGGNYLYLPTLATGSKTSIVLGGILPPYVTMPNIVSSDLTWAKPRTIGFGIEASAFENRLNVDYRWYQRTIFDQLGPADKLPEVLGTAPPQTNNAVSETRGWELSVSWRDKAFKIAGDQLRYDVRFALSDYIGYVVEYQDNVSGSRSGSWTPGEEFGAVYGYHSKGIATNLSDLQTNVLPGTGWYYQGDLMYEDRNGDGIIDSGIGNVWYAQGDRNKLGYNYPRYKYSGVIGLGWKNFDLSVLFDGVGKEVRYVNNFTVFGQTGSWSSRYQLDIHSNLDYWTTATPNAFFPRIYRDSKNFGTANDQYMLNLAHLRIKNLNLSYSLPQKWVQKAKLSKLAFNLSIENLGMIYYKSWLKLDPVMLDANGITYPPQRVYSLGIKVGI